LFYSVKSLLLTKGIKTQSPNIHRKTLNEFKIKFVDTGVLDMKLFQIYKKLMVQAETLLEIYSTEKWKRGKIKMKISIEFEIEQDVETEGIIDIELEDIRKKLNDL
jgi:uncharacterized protein (UPF0332 family)